MTAATARTRPRCVHGARPGIRIAADAVSCMSASGGIHAELHSATATATAAVGWSAATARTAHAARTR
ncbi:hypothetical protein [Nonomuraea bangladeshensis]|uniref:hypothetical protein n=1 Tax=Nonomuraea bangladeshensis TaxID=404385 RepID=UPI003C2AC058